MTSKVSSNLIYSMILLATAWKLLQKLYREKKKAQLIEIIRLLTSVLTGVGFSSSFTPKFNCLPIGIR